MASHTRQFVKKITGITRRVAMGMSLLICMLAAALWIRSYWVTDILILNRREIPWKTPDVTGLKVEGVTRFYSLDGLMVFDWRGGDDVDTDLSSDTWTTFQTGVTSPAMRPLDALSWYILCDAGTMPLMPFISFPLRPARHARWWDFGMCDCYWGPDGGINGTVGRCLFFPHWALVLLMAFWPGITGLERLSLRKKHREGLCPKCGYDLRASVDRCPECGTPIIGRAEKPST